MQEIAKTTEHVASKSIHLWRVNMRAVLHQVLDDMYHAASNLSQRLAHELEKEQEVNDTKSIVQFSLTFPSFAMFLLCNFKKKGVISNAEKAGLVSIHAHFFLYLDNLLAGSYSQIWNIWSFFLDRKRLCTNGKLIAFSDLNGQVLGLLRQIDTAKAVGTDIHVPNVNLTNTQQEHVKRISRITTVLEASLLKLDDAILLFHDF